MKIATELSLEGKRTYLRFLADNLRERSLDDILGPWYDDIDFQGTEAQVELSSFYSKSLNPIVFTFEDIHLDLEEMEEEE